MVTSGSKQGDGFVQQNHSCECEDGLYFHSN